MGNKHFMLVEGKDDLHVMGNLLEYHDIKCMPADHAKFASDEIVIKEASSVEKLFELLPIYLDDGDIEKFAILMDADTDLESRWAEICRILSMAGEVQLPPAPDQDGTILTLSQENRVIKVGVWLMPDNKLSGSLEDFIKGMVPENDDLWLYSLDCVAGLGDRCRFSVVKKSKAEVHTWLAWQKHPGRSLGVAIENKYFNLVNEPCETLISWITRVFELTL